MATDGERPALTSALSAAEFGRWYWLKRELIDFASSMGLRTGGSKADLTARITDLLAGGTGEVPTPARKSVDGLSGGVLTPETLVPAGQRATTALRAYLIAACGTDFRFDAHMRDFLARGDGTATLGDAVAHWHATRSAPAPAIGSQFEYNTFTRHWRAAHPGATHDQVVAAWHAYRSLPVDQRPPIT